MFPLHDRTRRIICRALFLMGGVLPIAMVVAWCLLVRSPMEVSSMRGRLEAALSLAVKLEKVSYPRPDCTLLQGIELSDPDTGQVVAAARLVEITASSHGNAITISQPQLDAGVAAGLKPVVQNWMRRLTASGASDWRFAAGELTLRWSDNAQTFTDCSAQLQTTAEGSRAEATLHLANTGAAQPIRFQWRRENTSGRTANSFKIENDAAPLPLSLVAVLAGRENHGGSHSTFAGTAIGMEAPDGWQGELDGKLKQIDLRAAVSEQFPHQLSGNAELEIKHAVVHAGRLEEAEGIIRGGPGKVSPSLLSAATAFLGLTRGGVDSPPSPPSAVVNPGNQNSYDELAAEFKLVGGGITIHGQCTGKQNGIIMRSGTETLLADSTRGPAPVVAIIQMLVPDSRVQVPATRQTDWLLNLLPVPDIVPGDPQAVPQARFRGGKDLH